MGGLLKSYAAAVKVVSLPIVLADFFDAATGREYGVTLPKKLALLRRMARSRRRIECQSGLLEHLVMAARILNIPRSVKSCVVECGCYKGGSTANLSLVCALVGRELEVFDSFQGLPNPSEEDRAHTVLGAAETHTYEQGAFAGSLEEVRDNIRRYGRLEVCNFHPGFFDETLPKFAKKCAFAFVDVDYRKSLETCVQYLWPLLPDGPSLYTHEAQHAEIARFFYDNDWWHETLAAEAPGLVGAGTGLGLQPQPGGFGSDLGYVVKNARAIAYRQVPQAEERKLLTR